MYLYLGYPGIIHFVILRSFFRKLLKLSDTIQSIIKGNQCGDYFWLNTITITYHHTWYGDITCQDDEQGHLFKVQAEYYETDIGHANKNSW